ncbi:hypothetical protein POP12_156 [Pectobacterium phage POP12]|nr:hypothetical protein POP12_156 [Pectobacterium phage POP12]
MSEVILDSVKRVLYKNGSYQVAYPKGDTSKWTVADWIAYIDVNGAWIQ